MKYRFALALVLLSFTLAEAGRAQVGTAVLVGRVSDPGGAIIVGAEVLARRISTNETFHAVTTQTGDYTIVNLPVDTYEVRISSAGFKAEVVPSLRLEIGQTARVNTELSVGAVS